MSGFSSNFDRNGSIDIGSGGGFTQSGGSIVNLAINTGPAPPAAVGQGTSATGVTAQTSPSNAQGTGADTEVGIEIEMGPHGHPMIPPDILQKEQCKITRDHTLKFWPYSWILDPDHDRSKHGWSVRGGFSKPALQAFRLRLVNLRLDLYQQGSKIADKFFAQKFRDKGLTYQGGGRSYL